MKGRLANRRLSAAGFCRFDELVRRTKREIEPAGDGANAEAARKQIADLLPMLMEH